MLLLDQEIWRTVKSMLNGKLSGSDGIIVEFFKKFWFMIGGMVCNDVKQFFNFSYFLREINRIFIILMVKFEQSKEIFYFLLISFYNVFYKIINKCLIRRLRGLLVSQ